MSFRVFIIDIGALVLAGLLSIPQSSASAAGNITVHAAAKISVCGNGVKEGGEHCDGAALGSATCALLGFSGGTLACSPSCEFNTASCTSDAQATAIPLFFADIGGDYTLSDTRNRSATIALPPNFYDADLRLQEFLYDHGDIAPAAPPPSGKQFAGNVYDFVFIHPDGEVISQVSKPVTLTLTYSDDDVVGLDETNIAPYRKESGESSWTAVSGATVDTAHNTVSFTTDHFSSFTLIAPPVSSTSSENRSSGSENSSGGGGFFPETHAPPLASASAGFSVSGIVEKAVTIFQRLAQPKTSARTPLKKPRVASPIAPQAVHVSTAPRPTIKNIQKVRIVDSPCRLPCRVAAAYRAIVKQQTVSRKNTAAAIAAGLLRTLGRLFMFGR